MHVLGIDAGGTKTMCLLADESGRIVAEGRARGANFQTSGEVELESVLRDVIEMAIGDRAVTPAAVCVGIAGVDREDEARSVHEIMGRIGYPSRVVVVNDALIALAAGAADSPGIVLIAGTGSIAYGHNGKGRAARSGGWGHIIGDEGSGYWIGREALSAVVRAIDGRGPATRLLDDVLEHFMIEDISSLPRIVYDRDLPRVSVAALGPIVQRASGLGDPVARRILERAADELALAAGSVASTLDMQGEAFVFVLAGGVFRVVPWLTDALSQRLIGVAPRSTLRRLDIEPAIGAVRLALAEAQGRSQVPQYKSSGR
jgi:N-acetylglucosamine kinase-like BadF-type ATPase